MLKRAIPLMAVLTLGLAASTSYSSTAIANEPAVQERTVINNDYWWPNRLDLTPLRKNDVNSSPFGANYSYAEDFKKLDIDALVADLKVLMRTSQDWWPADFGHYGPFFIRMSWHSAGTYRLIDGRGGADGGMQRFAPLNAWPVNASLDKARRLLWPVKQKYGNQISWSDLIVLAGTAAMDDMGFKTLGFAFGRQDAWEPEDVDWGPEGEWLGGNKRFTADRKLKGSLAATQMGLIYVNPEGPDGKPDPLLAAKDIREAFGRMAMNDEETLALIAGGHTFGKTHGAAPASHVGDDPEAAGLEQQGLGWKNSYKTGRGAHTITSGLEGAWTVSPAQWTHNFLENLFKFDWVQTKSPAGAIQWIPSDKDAHNMVPDAHDPEKFHPPVMLTTDLALKFDPEYSKIAKRFLENPEEFEKAFARAWFKLTHRDMGPRERYLGNLVPDDVFVWQDPVPAVDHALVNDRDIASLKNTILKSGLSTAELVRTAWASAASFRNTDLRGGANGARVRLEPQINWDVNNPQELQKVLKVLEKVQADFNKSARGGKKISLADVIVLGGAAAIEDAAKKAGHDVKVPFTPGRADATLEQTDVESFTFLELKADGFRNYFGKDNSRSPAQMLVERANLLGLTIPETTVLVGGMRVLGANHGDTKHGVFTDKVGTLNNAFFTNLITMDTEWKKSETTEGLYEGYERDTTNLKWTATPVDLIFGSNSELRAVAEVYAQSDMNEKFVTDFVAAWHKVMNLGRY